MAVHHLRNGKESLKSFFFLLIRMSFYHPFLCTLHFLLFFLINDFQLFIIQREAGSRRFWLSQCPFSVAWSSLFSLPSPHFLLFCHSCISVFHSSSHWPINHLCWREQPAVLCNPPPQMPSLVYKAKHGLTDCSLSLF